MCVHASARGGGGGGGEGVRERPYWKEGQGIECFYRLSSQRLWDQTAFVAHTWSKPTHCGMLDIIILPSMLTNMILQLFKCKSGNFV